MASKSKINLSHKIPTPHIGAKYKQIAKRVIMPGDPKRAKWIADNYLTNAKLVSDVRGMLAFTGTYKNTQVTVMAHGMGIPSACIYTYELFKFYDVDVIYRIGSCGATNKSGCELGDVVLVQKAFSDTVLGKWMRIRPVNHYFYPTACCNKNIKATAKKLKVKVHEQPAFCENFFYTEPEKTVKNVKAPCEIWEMESWGIFLNAQLTSKKAACLLTVSDNVNTGKAMTALQRQTTFKNMVKLALESIVNEKVTKYATK